MERLRDRAFAGAVFAADQDVRLGRTDARDQLQHWTHRRRFRNQHRVRVGLERSVFGFEPLLPPQGARQLDLGADDGQQPGVLPRLLDEIARAAAHRFDRDLDAAPRGHDHHRERRVVPAQLRQEIEALLAGRRVARVVQVHQHDVVLVAVDRLQDRRRRPGRIDLEPLGLQQQAQRLEHIRLIIGDENPRRRVFRPCGHRLAAALERFDRPSLCSSHDFPP